MAVVVEGGGSSGDVASGDNRSGGNGGGSGGGGVAGATVPTVIQFYPFRSSKNYPPY